MQIEEWKGEGGDAVIFDMPSCGGCRTCEMACSFKHEEEFVPSISSIKIIDRKEGPGYLVLLLEETGREGMACDGCKEFGVPMCMQYCPKSQDLKEMLDAFMKRVEAARGETEAPRQAGERET
jgi:Fe-S-cluster-containing hydrogenase component 2